jgi:anti-sigma factor RsiW
MTCDTTRPLLGDRLRGRLDAAASAAVDAHVATCDRCRNQLATEEALDGALDRLPRPRAPASLRRRLGQQIDAAALGVPPRPSPLWTLASPLVSGCLAAALVLIVGRAALSPAPPSGGTSPSPSPWQASALAMPEEAVNNHLRVVSSAHPADIESGGIHQVKPWFTGRLEFAPRVTFSGDEEFPLTGGSIGYFGSRKAAVFLFRHRLHAITLLVFEPQGLVWPPASRLAGSRLDVAETSTRGFTVLLWRDGGLGYALVSDVNRQDLATLAGRINQD